MENNHQIVKKVADWKDKPITFRSLERICKALDFTPSYVISFDDDYGKEEEG